MPGELTDLQACVEALVRKINREIWIVTSATESRRGGLVATWVSQASIDAREPIFVAGIAPNHCTAELIDESSHAGLHLLRMEQAELAFNFAIGSSRDRDKLSGLDLVPDTVSPILSEALAWMDCQVVARLATGDRNYYWLKPRSADTQEGEPLCERSLISAASSDQLSQLKQNREFDIEIQRPGFQRWLKDLPSHLRPS